jgi:hypothetical protein
MIASRFTTRIAELSGLDYPARSRGKQQGNSSRHVLGMPPWRYVLCESASSHGVNRSGVTAQFRESKQKDSDKKTKPAMEERNVYSGNKLRQFIG